jgi:TrmH family RNA methyltransferase
VITIRKLQSLPPSTRRRKIVRLLESWERSRELPDGRYLRDLAALVETDGQLPDRVREAAVAAGVAIDRDADVADRFRAVNALRHALMAFLRAEPAEWDLLPPAGSLASRNEREPADEPLRGTVEPLSGVMVYLESIRSPFNVGSIVRTAAALGVPLVGLSPECPALDHPRLVRSAMGALAAVSFCRGTLEDAVACYLARQPESSDAATERPRIVALEVGGESVASFRFPQRGILLLGSEELGLSPAMLSHADARVSIPMAGAKASLNVGVACGIALSIWAIARG